MLHVDSYVGVTDGQTVYVNTTGAGYADFIADTLVVQSVDTSGTQGTVALNSDGTITYERPAAWSIREDSYQYTITDATGQTDTVTNTITLHTAKPDVDVDSNNDGVIDGADDVIEEDPPGALVLVVEPEPIEDYNPDFFTPEYFELTVDDLAQARLAMRFDELASQLPAFDLVITTSGPIRLWTSGDKQDEVASGTKYDLEENSASGYFPSVLYAEAFDTGTASIRLALIDPRGIPVNDDFVMLQARKNILPSDNKGDDRANLWVMDTYDIPVDELLALRTTFADRADAVGVTLFTTGTVPKPPGINDYELKRGYVNEADGRIRTKILNEMKARIPPGRDPVEVANEILKKWFRDPVTLAPQQAILNAGLWHTGGEQGSVFVYPKP